MSQINMSNQISNRGKEIQDHLYSVNLESGFHRWTRSTKNEEDTEIKGVDVCLYCDQSLGEPYWEPRYNGIRARCETCKVAWNLS